jgi:Flp pilus assembly pilin Flp
MRRPEKRGFWRGEMRGASLLSYGLIVGLIAVVGILAVKQLGDSISGLFDNAGDSLSVATPQGGGGNGNGSEEGGDPEPTPEPAELAAVESAVTLDQTDSPGACVAVFFINNGEEDATGFGVPGISGDYENTGCAPTDCTGSLAGGATCSVELRGKAISSGALSGSLTVSAATGGSAEVTLTGTAGLSGSILVFGHSATGHIAAYESTTWSALTPPAAGPAGAAVFDFSADGALVAGAHATSPYVTVYDTNGGSGDPSTWTKLGNPSTLPTGQGDGIAFSPDDGLLAVAHDTSPYLTVYDTAGGSANTATWTTASLGGNPPNFGLGVSFSPDGAMLAVSHVGSPYVTIYNTTSWAKLSNPTAGLPGGTGYDVAFSHDGSLLAVAHDGGSYITIYDTAGGSANTGLWTKLSPPGTPPTGRGWGIAFSPDDSLLAEAHVTSPAISVYNTTTWAKLPNPTTLPTGNGITVAFSPDGGLMSVTTGSGNYLTVYDTDGLNTDSSAWSTVTLGSPPPGSVAGSAFSPY